jgi:hypothetical protein
VYIGAFGTLCQEAYEPNVIKKLTGIILLHSKRLWCPHNIDQLLEGGF